MRILLTLMLIFRLFPAFADEKIILGLSQDEVPITASFIGSELLIFGAVQDKNQQEKQGKLGVIVVVAGPNQPATVWRKERVFGIWVNRKKVEMEIAPSFYAIATSGVLKDILLSTEDLKHAISWSRVVRSSGQSIFEGDDFTQAFARIKRTENLFQVLENSVNIVDDTLFYTEIRLPANLVEGIYRTRIFLTRNGHVIDEIDADIPVFKVGFFTTYQKNTVQFTVF